MHDIYLALIPVCYNFSALAVDFVTQILWFKKMKADQCGTTLSHNIEDLNSPAMAL
jgi:hypothetical protein